MNADRLSALFDAHVDRRLTPKEKAELEEALLTSADARRLFWDHVSLHGLIHEAAQAAWMPAPARAAEANFIDRLLSLLRPARLAWVGALVLLLGLAGLFLTSKGRERLPAPGQVASPSAVLRGVQGEVVVTHAGADQTATNDLVLHEGMAIRVARGGAATVVLPDATAFALEGGATVTLRGADLKHVDLTAGRLTAQVARQPEGGRVELSTPLAHVRVHGTAFTLDAGERATRIDVREGRVRMAHARRPSEMDLAGGEFALALADRDLVAGLQPVPLPAPARWSAGDRDLARWPFSPDGPWNRRIGPAEFEDIASEGFDLVRHGAAILPARLDRAVIVAGRDDPEIAIVQRYVGSELARLRCPVEALRGVRPDGSCVIIDAERGFAHELSHVSQADGIVGAMSCLSNDLRGAGIPPENAGPSFSGLPLLAGLIRGGELEGGIRHALAATVLHQGLSRAGEVFVWPARHTPIEQKVVDHMGGTGNVHYGSLLAIPPGVDIGSLGVGRSGPAYEIARALQEHGAYVTHSYNAVPASPGGWVQPHIQFYADGVDDAALRALVPQLSRIAAQLKVVSKMGREEKP